MTKRIGVLGTLVWDRIWSHQATGSGAPPVEDWGGITYSLAALAAACPEGWAVAPLLKVGEDRRDQLIRFLRPLPNFHLGDGILVVPEPTNRVELHYYDEHNRTERLTGGVPGWRWEELAPLVRDLDALLVNFISGFEMALGDAERLRSGFSAPIYADLHSLFLDRLPDGSRVPRPLPEPRRWLRCFDAVQVNEDELARLGGGEGDLHRVGSMAVEEGVRLVFVTHGAAGAAYAAAAPAYADPLGWPAHRRAASLAGPLRQGRVPLPAGAMDGDPTGCGDVWGATVFASLLAGHHVEAAMLRANAAAARSVEHRGTATLYAHLRDAPSVA